jgi:hypothetical protein
MIQIDETKRAHPAISKSKSDSDVKGVRYRRSTNRPFQMIYVDNFDIARSAVRLLDDAPVLDSIRQAHPDWPPNVVHAEAFLHHYQRRLGEA